MRRPRDGVRGGARGTAAVRGSRDGDRSTSRPAAARRAAAGGAAKRTTAPNQSGLTARATALMVVLAALALGYAYPVRIYLTQVAEIDALKQEQIEQQHRIGELEAQAAKWHDDEYIKAQARARFYWVYPGETPLVPVWNTAAASPATAAKPPSEPPASDSWYGTLWSRLDSGRR